jgi:Tfp pilus assembly protein PilW
MLVETLVVAALFSLVIAGVYLLYTTMQATMSRGELKSDLQQNARVALDQMAREIRMAGYDPSGAIPALVLQPKAAIRAATPGCLSFVADVSGSGTSKQITYDLNGTTVRRRVDNWDGVNAFVLAGGAQPQAESLNLLTFTYYDAYDQVLTPASWTSTQRCPPVAYASSQANVQLDYWQMRQVRRVAIVVQTQSARPGIPSEFYTLTSDVRLRNR